MNLKLSVAEKMKIEEEEKDWKKIVAEQFMKMFQNCAIARNGAILEHFHELLRNHNSDL